MHNYEPSHSLKKNTNLNTIVKTSVKDLKTVNNLNRIFSSSVLNKSDKNIRVHSS
jgi:hypothetical protein